jgi:DNA repair protein RadC
MPSPSAPGNSGHRQRLKERFAATSGAGVADYELLELLLTYAIPRRDVKPLAKQLLATFGTLNGVLTAPPEQLATVPGLGPGSVVLVQVIQQLAMRVRREKVKGQPVLAGRLELLDYLYTLFASKTREECHVLYLDARLCLMADETLFTGTLTETAASPRDIIKRALELNAAGLVVAHNHPSGTPKPSAADRILTANLLQAAAAMSLILHDHLIIGTEAHYSFKGAGEI